MQDQDIMENKDFFSSIWKIKALPSVLIMIWREAHNRLPTRSNLCKRDINVLGNFLCLLCGYVEESVDHLFVTCYVSIRIWKFCYNWLGIQSVMANSLESLYLQLGFSVYGKEGSKA